MRIIRVFGTSFVVLALASWAAWARDAAGKLDVIVTPNNGVPALIKAGDTFEATLTRQATLRLAGAPDSVELEVAWEETPDKRWRARCTVSGDIRPGAYALEATTPEKTDRNVRAVYVVDTFPESYSLVHLADPHIGSTQHFRSSDEIFWDVIKASSAANPAFVVITGDLTQSAAPEEFRRFIEVLDTSTAPTFVCSGASDCANGVYADFFGVTRYPFWFGQDAYLVFDTSSRAPVDLGQQPGDLQVLRRTLMPARWAVGLTHRYDLSLDMRTQQVLFVDNPLDLLLAGGLHRANREGEQKVPWGRTALSIAPAAIDGALQRVNITPTGCSPLAPELVAPVE